MLQFLSGRSDVVFHHHPSSLDLTPKDGKPVNWAEVCKNAIPPTYTRPILFNGHLQTIRIILDNPKLPIYYKRWIFHQTDNLFQGQFAVDFAIRPGAYTEDQSPPEIPMFTEEEFKNIGSLDSKPMLVVLHGMNGGSGEAYLRRSLMPFIHEGEEWEACVINSRGCAGSRLGSGLLYNARSTWDLRLVIEWLQQKFPNRSLFALGFSMGANILIHYLAEEGKGCPIRAAAICSNPWNLEVLSHHLQSSFLMREIYSRGLTLSLKKYLETHEQEVVSNPDLDQNEIAKIRYLHEFDRAIQKPMWKYPTETVYYREASSVNPLLSVRVPLLALNSEDDPLSPQVGLPIQEAKQNPHVVLAVTLFGGHLGWFQQDGNRWFIQAMYNTLQQFWETIGYDRSAKESLSNKKSEVTHAKGGFCYRCGSFCSHTYLR
ncbi:Alpha/Beta hydrolase protein [Trichoderma chlorosporum]